MFHCCTPIFIRSSIVCSDDYREVEANLGVKEGTYCRQISEILDSEILFH